MTPPMTHLQHARAVAALGLPLVGSHVAQFSITLTDALMLGWYDVTVLAAQVLGGTLFFVLFLFGSGFAWAVMPMVAEAEAAGNDTQVRRVTRMGLWLSVLFAAATMPLFLYAGPIFRALGQEEKLIPMAAQYLAVQGWSIFPALLVMVLKSYLSALERAGVVLWITLGAVAVNVVVNYALIFGTWGAPELGILGAAIASLVVNLVSALLMILYCVWVHPRHVLFQRLWRPDWEAFGAVFRLGWPIGLTNLAEVGLFAASSVMMGWLGAVPLAAHGIALQIASITFMVHLGLSNAATVRAGQALGRHDGLGLRRGARVTIAMSFGFALITVAAFLLIPEPLMSVFMSPDDPDRAAVLAIGVWLLAAAALFQLVDAGQVIGLGLLRGLQDTQVPMWMAAISYWLVGLPVSYLFGFVLDLGGPGIWLGLAMGLAVAAVFMMWRFWAVAVNRPEVARSDRGPAAA